MKKIMSLFICLVLVLCPAKLSFASEAFEREEPRIVIDEETGAKAIIYDPNIEVVWVKVNYEDYILTGQNIGVSSFVARGTGIPTRTWQWDGDNPYYLEGEADNSLLYSNYLFTGIIGCSMFVNNSLSNNVLEVKFYRLISAIPVASFEVQPNTGVMPVMDDLKATVKVVGSNTL